MNAPLSEDERLSVVQNSPCEHDWERQGDGGTCKFCGWQEDLIDPDCCCLGMDREDGLHEKTCPSYRENSCG